MLREIAVRNLRNDTTKVLAAVAAGDSFIVTRHGEPVAEIRPLRRGRRTLVPREEIVGHVAGGSRIDPAAFREDIDRVIDNAMER